jgi:hypothetical protein
MGHARIAADLAQVPSPWLWPVWRADKDDRRGYDAHSCRIERVADKHAYALHGIPVRNVERRHPG